MPANRHDGKSLSRQGYTEEEIDRGLTELALCGGNARRASRQLAQRGYHFRHPTLYKWLTLHADRYEAVRREILPRIREVIATQSEDLAREYGFTEAELLERLREKMDELKPDQLGNTIRNVATSRGIATDKANVMRDRPTEIREVRSADDILRSGRRWGSSRGRRGRLTAGRKATMGPSCRRLLSVPSGKPGHPPADRELRRAQCVTCSRFLQCR